jgi:hypothetical protein
MAKKAAPKKPAPNQPKSVKITGKKVKPLFWTDTNGESPVLMDDGGSTRIRQLGTRLDTLLSTKKVTINSVPKAVTIRYIDFNGDQQPPNPLKITGTIAKIEVKTGAVVSVRITIDNVGQQTTIELLNGVTVTPKDDPRTGQRSYVGTDAGGISNITAVGTDGSTASQDTPAGMMYCLLHLKFPA